MAANQAKYLALLRGINVGGKNIIPKDDLKQCFVDLGCTDVRTYIQSGNVLFRSTETSANRLIDQVQKGLSKRFKYDAQAVVIPHRKYKAAVAAAPPEWGHDESCKHNAMFTLRETTPRKVVAQLFAPKEEIETVTIGPGVIFWSASIKSLTRTTLMKIAAEPVYQQLTVRNHNTVFKLLQLFDEL